MFVPVAARVSFHVNYDVMISVAATCHLLWPRSGECSPFPRGAWERELWLAHLVTLRDSLAEWILQELFAARIAEMKAFFAIIVVTEKWAIFFEFFVAFENFVELFEMIAILIDRHLLGAFRCIHFHAYQVAAIVPGIYFLLAQIAKVSNHLATILS